MKTTGSLDADWYLHFIKRCEDLDEMDELMNLAAADPTVPNDAFIKLSMYCRRRVIDEGWLN